MNIKSKKGFTLIELLVVISIISLLASVILASLNSARAKARDAKRKEDVLQLRTALELYYNTNGSYPVQYGGGYWGGVAVVGCGAGSVSGTTSGATAYITGLTPTYISVLPTDPAAPNSCSGYIYHSDGVDYKILIHASWEESYPTVGQPWYDPVRPTWALMLCSGGATACNTW